jgi:hypothetical protein
MNCFGGVVDAVPGTADPGKKSKVKDRIREIIVPEIKVFLKNIFIS